jgi:hypothetical protein
MGPQGNSEGLARLGGAGAGSRATATHTVTSMIKEHAHLLTFCMIHIPFWDEYVMASRGGFPT